VVFCTAHDRHATRAFEAAALDYLVKPVDPARLAAALARVRRRLAPRASRASGGERLGAELARARAANLVGWFERLVVRTRSRGKVEIVPVDDVLVFASEAHRAVAYTRDAEHVLEPSLAALEPQLDPARFARVHRAFVVGLAHVEGVEGDEVVLAGGRRAPISRRNRTAFLGALEAKARGAKR
jgi:DNA-binding LytR/AlgR family response regulator